MSTKVKFGTVVMAALLLLGSAESMRAHHSFSVMFDRENCRDLHGTLTGVDWENPHAWLRVDVKDDSGQVVPWRLEMITPNALARNGSPRSAFTENFGKVIQTRSCLAREGAGEHVAAAEYIKMADGLIRIVGQVVEDIGPEELSFWE
jgi:Family of unknown function (DUF6152)